jgi:hypothetical protein
MTKILSITIIIISIGFTMQAQKPSKVFKKGDVRLDVKLPHFNWLYLNPKTGFTDGKFGFNGYGIGVAYSYKNKRFVASSISYATTIAFPVPAPFDAEYNKNLFSTYLNITDNFVSKNFTFGYGLNLSKNLWLEWTRDLNNIPNPIYKNRFSSNNIGVTFNTYYNLRKTFNIGLIYQPNIYNITQQRFSYEHFLSIELAWRIKILNINKKS